MTIVVLRNRGSGDEMKRFESRKFVSFWKHLIICGIFVFLYTSLPVFSQDEDSSNGFEIHRMTLFSDGSELNTVPEGMLLEKDGILYVDAIRYFELFGYDYRAYPDSDMILFHQFNHRVLFMTASNWMNEVGSFFVKSQPNRDDVIGTNIPMQYPAVWHNDRYYVSLDDLMPIFGMKYDEGNYGILEIPSLEGLGGYRTSVEEVRDFARIIYYETRDSSMLKKTAVGGVVMNRVYSHVWPNTVHDVIYAPNQFTPVTYTEFSTLEPPAVQYEGAVRSLNGENTAPGCFFFNLAPFKGKEADFYQLIEGDYFYR